ncbi:hypothetical protein B0T10DRAFT_195387 [Thelonectria olida]|uniref:Zn(2)-C6 fungal-type domain-containing protein n=1 Tax=Thelonectria olida TaxID=1576542 RepID=A0A9P8VUY9_9HYPO|nr:hypothetical protein B0T10DRAFT_195387 [Thelonectria olida]
MKQLDAETGQRVRKHHTRNRLGCHTCRKSHIRCDGNLPVCTRCAKAGKACDFHTIDPPLRDRRAVWLPGQQQPWAVTPCHLRPIQFNSVIGMNSSDPFDCLPAQMVFQSRQLLYYFHHLPGEFSIYPRGKMDILPSIIQNSDALQDTLLVAGLHYTLATGDIRTYDSTVSFHKVESIQLINKSLENPQSAGITTLIRRIATLCLVESCFGNTATAEIHFDGLLTLLDLYLAEGMLDTPIEFDEELTSRYLVFTYNVIHAVRSRMQESSLVSKKDGWPRSTNLEEDVALLFSWHSWYSVDTGCLQLRLKAIAMLPFFLVQYCHYFRALLAWGCGVVECWQAN